MTELAMSFLPPPTQAPGCSDRCPDCNKPLDLGPDADRRLLGLVRVLCDPCAERRTLRMDAIQAREALHQRFRQLLRLELVTEDLQTCDWAQSRESITALNLAAWCEVRGWYRVGEKNLFLYGSIGVGKTWAARACLREAFVRGKSIAEVTARRMCKIGEQFQEGKHLMPAWKSAHVLLIDDIDKVAWTQERVDILWEVLDARTTSKKRTIVCSNLDSGPLLEALKAACTHQGQRNESHALAAMDRLKPVTKIAFSGASQRGHA